MDALLDEVESLEAILMDDVIISRNQQSGVPEVIETTVFPVVGDDSEQQYVCVTLQVFLREGYPDTSPDFKLVRPRGLDDARLGDIKAACLEKLRDSIGFPIVFDLIELVRDHLSGSNLPSGTCVICLYGFSEGDVFTRTECFHYLHSYCLARHLNALRRNYQEEYDKLPAWLQKTAEPFQAACPVCREHITDESDSLKCAMPPTELQNAPEFVLTDELRELQQRMSCLFLQQKSRGGIIDLEAEGAAVISIETEEEFRRRLQRKPQVEPVASSANENPTAGEGRNESEAAVETVKCTTDPKTTDAGTKPSSSTNTNFAPVVQQTQRISNDPTNNNYQPQYNRRHYRGGRRHHHHNRDRERDRERFEHNHTSSQASASAPHAATAGTNPNTNITGGKHSKAQATGSAHPR